MELKPTKAQILWLAEKYNTVPLSTTLPTTVTPTQVLQKLKTVSRHCYMLESCEDKESSGRYTFLGFDPQAEICPPLPAGWWATLPTTTPNTASRGWS